jgi:DNA-binding transcriptional MerR regulator
MAINHLNDKMLTVHEVSIILHIHPNTLRRWADKGLIKSFTITPRGDRRFMYRDIEQFLADMNMQNTGLTTNVPVQPFMSENHDLNQVSIYQK